MPTATEPMTLPKEYTREPGAALDRCEWLLTNGLGGFAMGTVQGTPSRRYHGLLVASLSPPVQRELMLHSLAETVVIAPGSDRERSIHLTPYWFSGCESPSSPHLVKFAKTVTGCTWLYRIGQGHEQVDIEKKIHLHRGKQAVTVSYTVHAAMDIVRLQLRPLVRMQDAHSLMHAWDGDTDFRADASQRHVKVQRGWKTLDMACDAGWFESSSQWWHNFAYEHERDRGYDWTEDLWSPGAFQLQLRPASQGSITITAWTGEPAGTVAESIDSSKERLRGLIAQTRQSAPDADIDVLGKLVAASDEFVVSRKPGKGAGEKAPLGVSIIAGYPWFSDWGRDSMISGCGLLLTTKRFEEARALLATFATHRRNGLIPNLFNDQSGEAEYNTADASLWFLHAACEYLHASEDIEGFEGLLKPACLDIIDAYREGTEFGIRVDPIDGLVRAGDASTQLTWMDARRDGICFTPRHGKPVELSALWYSGLLGVASAIKRLQSARAQELEGFARRTADHFKVLFWNGKGLHDVLEPGANGTWRPNTQVRPNQIFAVSLPRSALDPSQQKSVVSVVRDRLLTPRGLRTLAADDPGYKAWYRGPMRDRDAAYHNGTVWPWLLGPYAEAVMRAGSFSSKSRSEARNALAPLIARMDDLCPGQLPEVYDGSDSPSDPSRPGGCPAQAWSAAEVLRAWVMSWANRD